MPADDIVRLIANAPNSVNNLNLMLDANHPHLTLSCYESGEVLPVGGIRDKVLAARHPAAPEPPAGRRDGSATTSPARSKSTYVTGIDGLLHPGAAARAALVVEELDPCAGDQDTDETAIARRNSVTNLNLCLTPTIHMTLYSPATSPAGDPAARVPTRR